MQALGLIETRGLLPAIECADVMLKTAQVELVERTFVGGGLVTIAITGDVGAVKAAVEAGVTAVEQIGHLLLIAKHVIPRPHADIENIMMNKKSLAEEQEVPEVAEQPVPVSCAPIVTGSEDSLPSGEKNTESEMETTPESTNSTVLKELNKEGFDAFVQEFGFEKSVNVLASLSVVKLRNLAREYKTLGIAGRAISKANKELLIQKLTEYYRKESER